MSVDKEIYYVLKTYMANDQPMYWTGRGAPVRNLDEARTHNLTAKNQQLALFEKPTSKSKYIWEASQVRFKNEDNHRDFIARKRKSNKPVVKKPQQKRFSVAPKQATPHTAQDRLSAPMPMTKKAFKDLVEKERDNHREQLYGGYRKEEPIVQTSFLDMIPKK